MPTYHNQDGEPIMTAAQARQEAEIDAHAAMYDRMCDEDEERAERMWEAQQYEREMTEPTPCSRCRCKYRPCDDHLFEVKGHGVLCEECIPEGVDQADIWVFRP